MGKTITISSNNFNGELVNILFKPDNQDITINLGDVNIPYLFNTEGIIPPCDVYGTYTILVKSSDCPYFMNVVRIIPTPTPTPSITPTNIINPTSTPSITPSYPVYTPTPSCT
jgi:hypothetical protein